MRLMPPRRSAPDPRAAPRLGHTTLPGTRDQGARPGRHVDPRGGRAPGPHSEPRHQAQHIIAPLRGGRPGPCGAGRPASLAPRA